METTLQLIFKNEDGRQFSLTVPRPRPDLTEADVTAVMDLILDKNIFVSTGGALVEKVAARVISRDTVELATY
ncbi:MAG: DUF2922 domain-containing protein [Firmicutes bacterium]|nr:DUF2922 domain-containing protein [Bacillota bacterium]